MVKEQNQQKLNKALDTTLQPLLAKARKRMDAEKSAGELSNRRTEQSKVLIEKTVMRNVRLRGPDFFLGKQYQIKARMVHPLADLGVPELVSMIRELVALSRCR